jgi:signal transduction histidine kinase/CheY-like chemotaxis protein
VFLSIIVLIIFQTSLSNNTLSDINNENDVKRTVTTANAVLLNDFKNQIFDLQKLNLNESRFSEHHQVIFNLFQIIISLEELNLTKLNKELALCRIHLNSYQDALNKISNNQLAVNENLVNYRLVLYQSLNELSIFANNHILSVTPKITASKKSFKNKIEDAILEQSIIALVSVLCVLIIGTLIMLRIIEPIKHITDVFSQLILKKDIKYVSGQYRSDEIGTLAKAAIVFHEKNTETDELVSQTQQHNAAQATLNRALVKEKIKAENASKSKSDFLANMSHEIRTPMNGIMGLLDIVLSSKLTTDQREDLKNISYSTQTLMKVINDILDFSKIEAGKLLIEKTPFNTEHFFENFLSNIAISAENKGLSIKFYCSPFLPDILIGDPLRITQILNNLCTNAIKFTHNGEVNISIMCEAQPDVKQLKLSFIIKDTGIGISKEQQCNIFDSFTQADESTSRKFGGTGLGLSIVKQLVKLMDGELLLESNLGEGSTFTCCFKLDFETNKTTNTYLGCNNLHYFISKQQPFIADSYFKKLDIKVNYQSIQMIQNISEEHYKSTVILIDIHTLKDYLKIYDEVNVKFSHLRFALILDKTLQSQLKDNNLKLPNKKLFSPFTFKNFTQFIVDFSQPKNVSPILTNDAQQDMLLQFDGHILVVEDNMINQIVITKVLKSFGLTYDIANDGQQGVDKILEKNNYDLVLMDIQMPVMDGYTATRKLRSLGLSELIICGLSANAMKQDFEKAYLVGMNDYLTKPLDKKEISEVFEKYLCKSEIIKAK